MPAKSKAQQRLFGMVHAYQKGELENPSDEIKKIADGISKKDALKFAKTKHKKLPETVEDKKKTNESMKHIDEAKKKYKDPMNQWFEDMEDASEFRDHMDFITKGGKVPMRKKVKMTESQLKRAIVESVKRILSEGMTSDNKYFDKWDRCIDLLGEKGMLNAIWNFLPSNTLEAMIDSFDTDYELGLFEDDNIFDDAEEY